jgi:hypothetical protein
MVCFGQVGSLIRKYGTSGLIFARVKRTSLSRQSVTFGQKGFISLSMIGIYSLACQ